MNKVYINDNLRSKFGQIKDFNVTLLESPAGYGKLRDIRTYFEETNARFSILNILEDSPELIIEDLADYFVKLEASSENQSRNTSNELSKASDANSSSFALEIEKFKENPSDIRNFRNILKYLNINEDTYIIIDNYQYFIGLELCKIISAYAQSNLSKLHLIFLSDSQFPQSINQLAFRQQLLLIDFDYFVFSREDLAEYCELNNIKILPEMLTKIMQYSEGWLCAIDLYLEIYAESGDVVSNKAISFMVENVLWSKLNNEEKFAFIALSRLKSFSKFQADLLINNVNVDIDSLFAGNPFIIFNNEKNQYKMHYILLSYCEQEFDMLSVNERKEVIKSTASIFESMGNMFEALKAYYMANDYKKIVSLKLGLSELYPHVNSSNKEFFLSLIMDLPKEYRYSNYDFLMQMCMVLFLYNDRSNMLMLYNDIQSAIDNDEKLSDIEKDHLFGRLSYVRGYIEFNDIDFMADKYMNAVNLIEGSMSGNIDRTPWNFCVPSIAHLYHREMGSLEAEVASLEKCMPFYYNISNGHGKGAEAVFSAERFFYMGDFNSAKILCHKAAYMADSREQVSISESAQLLLAKMDILGGKYDVMMHNINEFSTKYDFNKLHPFLKKQIIDFCESTIYMIIGESGKIASWLTDWQSIESNTNIVSRSYANVIYGKYLLLTEQYEKLLGISSQFLGISAVYENIIPKIYTHIYIAIAYNAIGDKDNAMKMLRVAFDFAVDDNIIMPFVENADFIEDIYNNIVFDKEYRDFLRKIKNLAKDYCAGIRAITKYYKNRDNFGLTAREMDVAKLAAQRLTNKEIAERLFIAESTVKSNKKISFNKLNISSRTELSELF